ncbi:uncharacterized protein LOC135203903 [Macrobrachium nipponense]|uniref:uncharacterized protein LOC135203903 n=1 Tax=Macrobrachium nipponense TaxID=159736 RepID=UPI0030C869E8
MAWHQEGLPGMGQDLHRKSKQQDRKSHRIGSRHLSSAQTEIRAYTCGCRRPPSDGARYLLMVIDQSTRWPETTPMLEDTAEICAEVLLSSWVSCFGVPDNVTTDRGTAFTSELWTALARLMGEEHHTTIAYNLAANGMVERTHHFLKASLMARCTGPNWKAQLPWVLLGLRTAPRANSGPSPTEMVFRDTLTVPGEFFLVDSLDEDVPLSRL